MKRINLFPAIVVSVLAGLVAVLVAGCSGAVGPASSSPGSGTNPSPPAFAITTVSIPLGVVGSPYSTQLTAANGTGALTWSALTSLPSIMPNGLSLSTSGLLSGTPTASSCGNSFTVMVTDSSTPQQTANATFTPDIEGFYVSLRVAQIGVFYNDGIQLQCAVSPVSWSLVSGAIPPGLQLQPFPGNTYQLNFRGTPTTAGSYNFTVQAIDASGRQGQQAGTITVLPPALVLTDTVMQTGAVNQPFDHSPTTTGGTPPYQFSVSSGSLPPGLTLNAATADISGKPTTAAFYQFNLHVTDSTTPAAFTFDKPYTLLVTPAPLPARNDSIATATPIFPGTYTVSLSPYADATGKASADQDFYSMVVNAGDQYDIGVSSQYNEGLSASNPGSFDSQADPALEILNHAGDRIGTCNDPVVDSATSSNPYLKGAANFTDPCVDHGAFGTRGGSTLIIKMGPGLNQTIYIHVFDFEGRARPDFIYTLVIHKN